MKLFFNKQSLDSSAINALFIYRTYILQRITLLKNTIIYRFSKNKKIFSSLVFFAFENHLYM